MKIKIEEMTNKALFDTALEILEDFFPNYPDYLKQQAANALSKWAIEIRDADAEDKRPSKQGSCFWCGKPATHVTELDDKYICQEHAEQALGNGWVLHDNPNYRPEIVIQ